MKKLWKLIFCCNNACICSCFFWLHTQCKLVSINFCRKYPNAQIIIGCQYLPDKTTSALGNKHFSSYDWPTEIKQWKRQKFKKKGGETVLKSNGFGAGCFPSHILSNWCFPLNKFVETIPNQIHFGTKVESEKGEEQNIQILWQAPIYDIYIYGHLFMTTKQVSSNSFVSFSKLQAATTDLNSITLHPGQKLLLLQTVEQLN